MQLVGWSKLTKPSPRLSARSAVEALPETVVHYLDSTRQTDWAERDLVIHPACEPMNLAGPMQATSAPLTTAPRSFTSTATAARNVAHPVPDALVHGLRHGYATELANSGTSVYTGMQLLGHES
jgi:integrase